MYKLNEDLFTMVDSDVPEITPQPDLEIQEITPQPAETIEGMGVSNLIMQTIKDVYTMIEGYNTLYLALSDVGEIDKMGVINSIISNEHSNINALQTLLSDISPSADNAQQGDGELKLDFYGEWE